MKEVSKTITTENGEETIVINSQDNYKINLNSNYKLANHVIKKENKFSKKFKGSILGTDIGIKSGGFSNIAILAVVLALAAVAAMYFMWRF